MATAHDGGADRAGLLRRTSSARRTQSRLPLRDNGRRKCTEAEDIAQSAFERALRGLTRFDPSKGQIDAWLWRIVVNVARDAGRTATRRRLLFERLVHFRVGTPTDRDDIPSGIEAHELLEAVRGLTPLQRSVIALRYGADLDSPTLPRRLVSRTAAG